MLVCQFFFLFFFQKYFHQFILVGYSWWSKTCSIKLNKRICNHHATNVEQSLHASMQAKSICSPRSPTPTPLSYSCYLLHLFHIFEPHVFNSAREQILAWEWISGSSKKEHDRVIYASRNFASIQDPPLNSSKHSASRKLFLNVTCNLTF